MFKGVCFRTTVWRSPMNCGTIMCRRGVSALTLLNVSYRRALGSGLLTFLHVRKGARNASWQRPYGHIDDLQVAANATLRGLINNLSIRSGPQVVVNDDRLSPDETGEDLYPWKRWHVRNDPVGNNARPPVDFFMPTSNTQSQWRSIRAVSRIADDISAIPKYVGGQAGAGGAGRTASGLAMLMGNASKIFRRSPPTSTVTCWSPPFSACRFDPAD